MVARQFDGTTLRLVQQGQPLTCPSALGRDLLTHTASHSWSSAGDPSGQVPLSHFHQTFFIDPATTSRGVKSPFLVGCHSLAKSGCVVARQLEGTVFCPEQQGQLFLFLVRLSGVASHSWSSAGDPSGQVPLSHFHQTFFLEPATMSRGVKSPFLVGCHSLAKSGCVVAKQFDGTTLRLVQQGQPLVTFKVPCVLPLGDCCHSWSSAADPLGHIPLSHFHQTLTALS